jgi:peptidoglycan/LPS O-acetylase OafA/YrhL
MMTYRNDIDGLRAIAVLAVILYHLDVSWIPGGFVGVDIFFVISGFLITQTIRNDILEHRFTITHFYIKRIRRIIPALFVITVAAILMSIVVLPLSEMKEFAKSVISVATFTSNLFFWQHSDYFSVAAELKPLLHTWSLGIEEQFYILFPLFMLFTAKARTQTTIAGLMIFALLSFMLSALGFLDRAANFYLPITRFWELLAGALLAYGIAYPSQKPRLLGEMMAILGLGLIALSLITLDRHDDFPGVNALYPVLGSVLIIYGGSVGQTWTASLLSSRGMRYIGLISYSLYLWHWVLISLMRNVTIGTFGWGLQAGLLLGTFALSVLTYHGIEQPFRKNQTLKAFLQIKTGILALAILAISAMLYYVVVHLKQQEIPRLTAECFREAEDLGSVEKCSFGETNSSRRFLLFGDSHAGAIYPVFERLAVETGSRGIAAVTWGCPPLFGVFRADGMDTASGCTGAYADHVKRFLEESAGEIGHVYLVARWTLYEKGWIKNGRLQRAHHFLSDAQQQSSTAVQSAEVLARGLERTVEYVANELHIPVTIIKSPPSLNTDIHRRFGVEPVSRAEYLRRMRWIDAVLARLQHNPRVTLVDPLEHFCPGRECLLYLDGTPLYTDDNHVSVAGAMRYYPQIRQIMQRVKEGHK